MQELDLSVQSILVAGSLPRGLSRFKVRLAAAAENLLLANTSAAAIRIALQQNPSLAIITESLGRQVVVDLLNQLRASSRPIPAVVVCDEPLTEWTVRYVKAGAMDCLTGPSDECYVEGLNRCLEAILSGPGRGRFFCDDCPPSVPFVGKSPAAEELLQKVRMVAFSRCNPVLILGATGVGKELVAKALHCWRSGEQAPMVAVNCAALTATLMESELFGHVKGAFTGADRDKPGLFEVAENGSIFLDEISEMPPELQGKLLRVLQERTFRRVGGTSDITCNATVIAASNRELFHEAKQGRFRQDLYYRLAVFPIHVEPLSRDRRRDDITLLAEYFVENSSLRPGGEIQGVSPEALERLLAHNWPETCGSFATLSSGRRCWSGPRTSRPRAWCSTSLLPACPVRKPRPSKPPTPPRGRTSRSKPPNVSSSAGRSRKQAGSGPRQPSCLASPALRSTPRSSDTASRRSERCC